MKAGHFLTGTGNPSRRQQGCLLLLVSAILSVFSGTAEAQRTPPAKPGRGGGQNVSSVDRKADEAQQSFMRASAELAKEYEELGELGKAQQVLQNMLKLSPGVKQIEEKIKALNEQRLSQNEAGVEVDPNRGWVSAKVAVEKGKTIRFLANGDCRITINQLQTGPEGVPSDDLKTDLISGVPLGGLMGMIVDNKGKTGQPFAIGQKLETTADTTGQLFLRVNVPPQAKVTGRYRVQVSGDILMSE